MGAVHTMVALIYAALASLACETATPFERALKALEAGDRATVEALVAAEPDPVARDILRLSLATEQPVKGAFLCGAVTTPDGREKCMKMLGRPHMNAATP